MEAFLAAFIRSKVLIIVLAGAIWLTSTLMLLELFNVK
jgi:hypothetical protein